jgi:hypothetical protein
MQANAGRTKARCPRVIGVNYFSRSQKQLSLIT